MLEGGRAALAGRKALPGLPECLYTDVHGHATHH
jgi:hypothetical protein